MKLESNVLTGSKYLGCLLGGAVGDSMGAPIEFLSWPEIQTTFGAEGLTKIAPSYGKLCAITDDTQMMLFTAEGLLRARARQDSKGICHIPSVVSHAYLRWLYTQGESNPAIEPTLDGWLYQISDLHDRRAPGNTCLSALASMRYFGDKAENNSKGCGGIMRIAPVALAAHCWVDGDNADWAFDLASELCALTHGHPTGQLAGGYLAALLTELLEHKPLQCAINATNTTLAKKPNSRETLKAVQLAISVASNAPANHQLAIGRLGEGWVAEEALAIGLYAVLISHSLEEAIKIAVNHSGDSDSTGLIAGHIAGSIYGVESIPKHWLASLELREEIAEITHHIQTEIVGNSLFSKYPPH